MKTNHNKATPRVYHTLRQIVQRIPRWLIEKTANAVKWQIWTGLLTHLLLHYLKFLSGWDKAFSRLAGIVRSAVWMDLDIVETLRLYGMASPNMAAFHRNFGTRQPEKSERKPMKSGLPQTNYAPMGW